MRLFTRPLEFILETLFSYRAALPTPETTFLRDKPLSKLSADQVELLRDIFKQQWALNPHMSLGEKCFFVADYLIPENFISSWGSQTAPSIEKFLKSLNLAKNRGLINKKLFLELKVRAYYYCTEVAAERQKREHKTHYRSIIKAHHSGNKDDIIFKIGQQIPPECKKEIENELQEENLISTRNILLFGFFSFCLIQMHSKNILTKNMAFENNASSSLLSSIHAFVSNCNLLPLAMATSTQAHFYSEMPEFLQGSAELGEPHNAAMELAIEESLNVIHPFLEKPTDQPKVVVLGENHGESFYQKMAIFNILKQWTLAHPENSGSIKFIYELNQIRSQNREVVNEALNMEEALKGFQDPKNSLVKILERDCFNPPPSFTTVGTRALCSMHAISSYGFNFTTSFGMAPPLSAEQEKILATHLDPKDSSIRILLPGMVLKVVENFSFSFQYESFERAMMITLEKLLASSKPKDIIVVITGATHLLALGKFLTLQPHLLLGLLSSRKFSLLPLPCIIKFEDCSEEQQTLLSKNKATFWVDPNPGDRTYCERIYSSIQNGDNFMETNKAVTRIGSVLPKEPINSLSNFFAPKSAIKKMKERFGQSQFTSEESASDEHFEL